MGGPKSPYLYPSPDRPLSYPYSSYNPRAASQAAYQARQIRNIPQARQDGPLLRFPPPAPPTKSFIALSESGKVNYTPAANEQIQENRRSRQATSEVVNFNRHPDSWMIAHDQRKDYKPMPANTRKKVVAIRWVQFALRVVQELGAMGLLTCMICFTNVPEAFLWVMRVAPGLDVIVTLYAIYHLIRPATARTPASSASYHIFALCNDVAILPFYVYTWLSAKIQYGTSPQSRVRWGSLFSDTNATTTLLFTAFITGVVLTGLHAISAALDLWLIVLFRTIAKLPPDVNPLEDTLTSRPMYRNKHKYKNSEVTLTESYSEKRPGYLSSSALAVEENTRNVPSDTARGLSAPVNDIYETSPTHRPQQTFSSPSRGRDDNSAYLTSYSPSKDGVVWSPTEPDRAIQHEYRRGHARKPTIADYSKVSSPARSDIDPSTNAWQSQQKPTLTNDNWYVLDDNTADLGAPDRPLSVVLERQDDETSSFHHQPLGMNPPTPPIIADNYPDPDAERRIIPRKALSTRADSGNANLVRYPTVSDYTSVYSQDETGGRPGTPKGKYYGDLAAATRGVLGRGNTKAPATTETSRILSTEIGMPTWIGDTSAARVNSTSALSSYGSAFVPDRQGRMVSRTGVDIVDMAGSLRGRRDVSGKVAEEDRGGGWWPRMR